MSSPEMPHILVIDDDPFNHVLLAEGLGDEFELLFAKHWREVVEIVGHSPRLDLVILDVDMPEVDGFEVCWRLKDTEFGRELPLIFMTGVDDVESQIKGFSLGAVDYIMRPFALPVVRARLRTHVTLRRQTQLLQQLALMDGLTGIANRRCFDQHYHREWRRALRTGCPLGLALIDADHFKLFNDRCGHGAGDDCLRRIATLGREAMRRPGDLIARVGGEEFALLLPETEAAGVHCVVDKLREGIAARLQGQYRATDDGLRLPVTVSIGCGAIRPDRLDDPADFLTRIDRRLYRAKSGGRNRVVSDDGA